MTAAAVMLYNAIVVLCAVGLYLKTGNPWAFLLLITMANYENHHG